MIADPDPDTQAPLPCRVVFVDSTADEKVCRHTRAKAVAKLRAGLEQITVSSWCSAHDRPRFYSHRASGGSDGRMVAYLGIPSPGAGGPIDGTPERR